MIMTEPNFEQQSIIRENGSEGSLPLLHTLSCPIQSDTFEQTPTVWYAAASLWWHLAHRFLILEISLLQTLHEIKPTFFCPDCPAWLLAPFSNSNVAVPLSTYTPDSERCHVGAHPLQSTSWCGGQ